MAGGHRLNTSIVLAAVHGLSGLFRAVSAVEPSLCRPLPTLSPSLIGPLASMEVKHQERKERIITIQACPGLKNIYSKFSSINQDVLGLL